jgi:hypothetical protein
VFGFSQWLLSLSIFNPYYFLCLAYGLRFLLSLHSSLLVQCEGIYLFALFSIDDVFYWFPVWSRSYVVLVHAADTCSYHHPLHLHSRTRAAEYLYIYAIILWHCYYHCSFRLHVVLLFGFFCCFPLGCIPFLFLLNTVWLLLSFLVLKPLC